MSAVRSTWFVPFVVAALTFSASAQLQNSSKRGLNEVLQPSEAELSKRVTPIVRAVRETADSVMNVILVASDGRGGNRRVGQGSGVILDENGLAITNWHVVALAADRSSNVRVQVNLRNKTTYSARVLSTSREFDLALLQLALPEKTRLKPITMGDSDSLMIGETMIAIGNPKGHQNTVTAGVLSAIDREINVRTPDGVRKYTGLLQTDAAINQGNSGGALLDITGRLIGINNAVATDSENIGFAIPVNTVRRVFHRVLLSSENLTAVYLGMQVKPGSRGMVIDSLAANGPAARSGLLRGDRITKINNRAIATNIDYARSLLGVEADRPLPVTVQRAGREVTHRVIPMSNAARTVVRRIGLELEVVTEATDRALVERGSREVYRELGHRRWQSLKAFLRITRVHKGSPAAALGIKEGDVLLGIVDRVPQLFGTRNELRLYKNIRELNDSLHVLANRYRDAEYTVWLLRKGEVLDGPLDIPRLN